MATRPVPRRRDASRRAPHLRVVEGAGRRTSRVPVVIVAILMVFGVTAIHAVIGQDGLKVASLEREVAKAQEEHTLMRAKVAQLSSPGRIAAEADKLHLVPAPDPVFLRLEGGRAAPQAPRP